MRAIVTAAARILERDGYQRANVNRIAALAGVSVGSLYQYFPTKEALVAEVARDLSAQMLAVFQHGLLDLGLLPMRDAVRGAVLRAVRAFRVNPRLRQVIVEELPQSSFDNSEFDRWFTDALRAYLEVHRERIRPKNVDLAVLVLMSSVEGVARAAAARGGDEEEIAEELSRLAWAYLTGEE